MGIGIRLKVKKSHSVKKTFFLVFIILICAALSGFALGACQHHLLRETSHNKSMHQLDTKGQNHDGGESISEDMPVPSVENTSVSEIDKEAAHVSMRQKWVSSIKQSDAWSTRTQNLQSLSMKAAPLIMPPDQSTAATLKNTFAAMDNLRSETPSERLRLSVFGNSLIASDNIVRAIRESLEHLYGSAGRGFLLMHPQLHKAPRRRTANGSWHWNIHKLVMDDKTKYPKGIGGLVDISEGWKTYSRFHYTDEDRLTVFWWDHPWSPHWNTRMYPTDEFKNTDDYVKQNWPIKLDIQSQNKKKTQRSLGITDVQLVPNTDKVRVGVNGKYGVFFGASLENTNNSGAMVDTMGIIATDAEDWEHVDQDVYIGMMTKLSPTLVVHILGGNEIKKLAFKWKSLEQYQEAIPAWIARSKKAVPNTDCLVVGPPQNIYRPGSPRDYRAARKAGKKTWHTRAEFYDIEPIFREAAALHGCAYLDMYQSMGGEDAFKKLHGQGWLQPDFIHPRRTGLDMMGQLIVDSILNAYAQSSG